ncbi:MAG: tRNA-dihydrouridine synthase family protein [Myxococcota bacterium]
MLLALAPMEGISDSLVRDLLSEGGGMDFCVTEFIRVSSQPVSEKVLLRDCPELLHGGRTPAGTPVYVQLLGGDPDLVAESAVRAESLGAPGIDLNFGCPARRVNGHDGGASLLRTPARIERMVGACRAKVRVPVTAKIRLGWDSSEGVEDLARAAEAGGAHWLTIHGRTKVQMYRGQADWGAIARARRAVSLPVIANGDVLDPQALALCRQVSGCDRFMVGRGAFRTPNLFRWLRGIDAGPASAFARLGLLLRFAQRVLQDSRADRPQRVALNRLKGWVRAMGEADAAFAHMFETFKRQQSLAEAVSQLTCERGLASKEMPILEETITAPRTSSLRAL